MINERVVAFGELFDFGGTPNIVAPVLYTTANPNSCHARALVQNADRVTTSSGRHPNSTSPFHCTVHNRLSINL